MTHDVNGPAAVAGDTGGVAASPRRHWLVGALGSAVAALAARPAPVEAAPSDVAGEDRIRRGRPLRFPRDHGAHPGAQTEWWYATGHLAPPGTAAQAGPTHGFQVTFFRSRTGLSSDPGAGPGMGPAAAPSASASASAGPSQLAAPAGPARLAPLQILFAHAALTRLGDAARHAHDQRIARWNGVATDTAAHARRDDLGVAIAGWQLHRDAASGHYRSRIDSPAQGFALDLQLQPTQPLLLQGDAGFSRKGPEESQASHYTSHPQLAVQGQVVDAGRRLAVQGRAWLDHEWSDTLLAPEAQGWDWIGFNLADGSALTAFQIRARPGAGGNPGAPLWAGGSWRAPGQAARELGPGEVRFEPLRWWTSRASGARYPVVWRVSTPVGRWEVRALLDAQELDSTASTGAIYWEGLSALHDDAGRRVGLGYLEMTGHARPLRLSSHVHGGLGPALA